MTSYVCTSCHARHKVAATRWRCDCGAPLDLDLEAAAIDRDALRRRPVLANVSGGLSGPAIRPLAVFLTWQVARSVKVPIVGMGGIMTARDALEFLLAGATAVQTGTVNFVTPSSAVTVARDLSAWLSKRGIGSVREIVGTLDAGRAS